MPARAEAARVMHNGLIDKKTDRDEYYFLLKIYWVPRLHRRIYRAAYLFFIRLLVIRIRYPI